MIILQMARVAFFLTRNLPLVGGGWGSPGRPLGCQWSLCGTAGQIWAAGPAPLACFGAGTPDSCTQSTYTANNVAGWNGHGIDIAGVAGTETTVAQLTGAVTTLAGYTRQAQGDGSVAAPATCTGTATDTTATPNCATAFAGAANTLAASCPAGCDYAAEAAITCPLGFSRKQPCIQSRDATRRRR